MDHTIATVERIIREVGADPAFAARLAVAAVRAESLAEQEAQRERWRQKKAAQRRTVPPDVPPRVPLNVPGTFPETVPETPPPPSLPLASPPSLPSSLPLTIPSDLPSPSPSPHPPSPTPPMTVVVEPADASGIREVFAHYRAYHPRAFPTPKAASKEWRAVKARLEEGYSVEDLKRSIDGYHCSPFHLGENDRGTKYLDLELIVRDGSHVAKGIEGAEAGPGPVMNEKERRGTRAGLSWMQRKGAGNGHERP